MRQLPNSFAQQRDETLRICMATRRHISPVAFQAALYEAEDVLSGSANVDLIEIRPGWGFEYKSRWQRSLVFRGVIPRLACANPGLQSVPLTQDYDIFIAVCQNLWDLLYFNAIDGWQKRCKVSVCWVGELWAADIARYAGFLGALQRFDHVILTAQGSVDPLSQFLGRQCHLVTTAADTLRFNPFSKPADRSIDVYSIGRRWEGVHQALLGAASEQKLFYIYDTCRNMAEMRLFHHGQHRDLVANLAKRSKYFMVSPGKMNRPDETLGQVELGYRYFEGAAAGAVMIGQAADCQLFRDLFPWPDAVVEIRPDGSDVLDVIAHLESTPGRVCAASRRNAVESLLRHDWIHRWIEVFQIAGIEPSPGMAARVERLKDLARAALATPTGIPDLDGAAPGAPPRGFLPQRLADANAVDPSEGGE